MFTLVHPNRPETWRNSRAPFVEPHFTEELARIGGLNEHREPNLRLAWGQTRTQFRRGKDRLLYIDERIPAIKHTRNVLKRPLLTDESGRVTTWETKIIDRPPDILPEGWLYENEVLSIEWIGEQWFYIEQWFTPEVHLPNDEVFMPFGTPEQWEKDRYEDWEDPELGMVRHCDVLGPFPREGRYTSIWRIVAPFSYFEYDEEPITVPVFEHKKGRHVTFSREPAYRGQQPAGFQATGQTITTRQLVESVCFRPPAEIDLQFCRVGRHQRDHRHIEKTEQRGRDKFYEDKEKRVAARDQRRVRAREYMRGEQWRWKSPDSGPTGGVGGGARIYLDKINENFNKPKKEDKAA